MQNPCSSAVSWSNIQSETLILGNKLMGMGKLYSTLALSLYHDLGQKKKKNIFFDLDIVVKNKLIVV